MRSFLRRAGKGIAIGLIAVIAMIFAERSTSFQDLDQLGYDLTVDDIGLSSPSPDIVLVDFDEETFQSQKVRQYPLPRSMFTDVIRRVSVGKPRVIGLDVLLSEPRDPTEDKEMQAALTEAGNVILASQAPNGTLPLTMPLPLFCQPEDPTAASGFCVEGKPGAEGYGAVNMPIDPDGFIRSANLFIAGATSSESYPLRMAEQFAQQSVQPDGPDALRFLGHRIPYANKDLKTMLIGVWGREPATRVPAWKLLAGQVPASVFTDKLVLIGQTSDASRDTHFTPLFRVAGPDGVRLELGGTAIHAAAIRTLLEGRAVTVASKNVKFSCILVCAAAASMLLLSCDLSIGVLGLLGLMGTVLGGSLLMFAKWRFWLPYLPIEESLAITLPITISIRFLEEQLFRKQESKEREQMKRLFGSYVDKKVVDVIWQRRSEVCLPGKEQMATVMFTDIRSFTAMSSGQPAAVVLKWLNRYVKAMDEVITAHGGFLNKFIGDGLMIIFGLPLEHGTREDARSAMKCAVAMLERVEKLNEQAGENPDLPHLRIGIGIHTGTLVAGSIGSASRQEYSVIGETVNLASRLESLNKKFGTEIVMSAATMELVEEFFPEIEPLGATPVAGLKDPVPVFTLRVGVGAVKQVTESGAMR
jgi:class 3 adenylate cyclase/CHASE2 domain-containing sensor protein